MKTANGINLTMLCDYYELTMGNGYWKADMSDRITYFDVFFRSIPDSGGFAIAAGLEQIVDYVRNLHFSEEDLDYLRGRGMFVSEELSLSRRYLGNSGRNADFPGRADYYGSRAGH